MQSAIAAIEVRSGSFLADRYAAFEERREMARLQAERRSLRQIAAALDRAPATIAREVKRNGSSRQRGYQVAYAQQQARARRWRGSKLERDAALREQVLVRRKAGWSPEQAEPLSAPAHCPVGFARGVAGAMGAGLQ